MNVAFHQIIDGGVDQAVARHCRYAAKCLGDDSNAKMTVATGCARVPGMQVAFVLDAELDGSEAALEALAQALRAIGGRAEAACCSATGPAES